MAFQMLSTLEKIKTKPCSPPKSSPLPCFLYVYPIAEVKLVGKVPPPFHPVLTRTYSVLVAVLAVQWTVMALALFSVVALGAGGNTAVIQHQVTLLAA